MLLTKLAEPYRAENLLEMSKGFSRERHPLGAEWVRSTNGDDFYHTPYPFPCHLFRGQYQHIEPRLPSISRGLDNYTSMIGRMTLADQALIVLRVAKSHWFTHELDEHPAIAWAKENRYTVNKIALAQHYELETGFIDISHDFDVAAFFATCRKENGEWVPVTEGVGVIYIYDIAKAKRCNFRAEPVSLQPLPRPTAQKAWVLEVPFGLDFEEHPALTWIKFKHNQKISQHFLELFDYGKALFPNEPIARVAETIKSSPKINEKIIDSIVSQWTGIEGGIEDGDKLRDEVAKIVELNASKSRLMENENIEIIRSQWESELEIFGTKCTTIPIALQIHPPQGDAE